MSIKTYLKKIFQKLQLSGEEPDSDSLVETEQRQLIPILPETQVESEPVVQVQTDVEETPVEERVIEEVPSGEIGIEEVPLEEVPIKEASIEKVSSEELPVEDKRIEDKRIEENVQETPANPKKQKRLTLLKKWTEYKNKKNVKSEEDHRRPTNVTPLAPLVPCVPLVPLVPEKYTLTSTIKKLSDAGVCSSRICGILRRYQVVMIRDFLEFYPKHIDSLQPLLNANTIAMGEVVALYEQLSPYYSLTAMVENEWAEHNLVAYGETCVNLSEADKMALECYCIYYMNVNVPYLKDLSVIYPSLVQFLLKLPFIEKKTHMPVRLFPLCKQLKRILYVYREAHFQTKTILDELSELLPEDLYQHLRHKVQFKIHFDSLNQCQYFLFQQRYAAICQKRIDKKRGVFLLKYHAEWADVQQKLFAIPTMEDVYPYRWEVGENKYTTFPVAFIGEIENAIATIAHYPPAVVFSETTQLKWGYTETTPFVYPYYLCHGGLPLFFILQQHLERLGEMVDSLAFINHLLEDTHHPKPSCLTELLDDCSIWTAYDELENRTFLRSDSPEIETIRAREFVSVPNEVIIRVLGHVCRDTFCLFGNGGSLPANRAWNKRWLIDKALTRYVDFNHFYRSLRLSYLHALETNEEIDIRKLLVENAKEKLNGVVAVEDELCRIGVSMLLNDIMAKV